MYNTLKSFAIKLNLVSEHVNQGKLIPFKMIKYLPVDAKSSHKYSTQIYASKNEFERRIADFKIIERNFCLMIARYSFDCSNTPAECQMELIEHCDWAMKSTFFGIGLNKIFAILSTERFQCMKAMRMITSLWILIYL